MFSCLDLAMDEMILITKANAEQHYLVASSQSIYSPLQKFCPHTWRVHRCLATPGESYNSMSI